MRFNNCGNLGLPLAVLAFGKEAIHAAVVMFLVSNLLHFSFGAWLLNHHARLRDLWKVPVIFATVLGLGLNLANIPVWVPLLTATHLLGDIAVQADLPQRLACFVADHDPIYPDCSDLAVRAHDAELRVVVPVPMERIIRILDRPGNIVRMQALSPGF